jgi:hypothetical protein
MGWGFYVGLDVVSASYPFVLVEIGFDAAYELSQHS